MKFSKSYIIFGGIIVIGLLAALGQYIFKNEKFKNIPTTIVLQVPFITQAPSDNWSRNEDCEEASIAMANAYLNNSAENDAPALPAQEAINNLKKWEQINLGYNADTGAAVTTRMAQGALGLKVKQIQNFTETDLKTALINKNPILLPINAKLLGSPQYLDNGPTYHMIVIKGFRDDIFIVNDPGASSGESNEYSFSILQKASADWDNATKIMDLNKKIALVLSK